LLYGSPILLSRRQYYSYKYTVQQNILNNICLLSF
jgi:hypothetical protein